MEGGREVSLLADKSRVLRVDFRLNNTCGTCDNHVILT